MATGRPINELASILKMKKLTFILLAILSTMTSVAQKVKPNSIGVVKYNRLENDSLCLDILLPPYCLDSLPFTSEKERNLLYNDSINNTFSLSKSIVFADENKTIYEFKKVDNFKVIIWCENDGGIEIIVKIEVKVPKNDFKANYIVNELLENIICFAIVDMNVDLLTPAKYADQVKMLKKVDFDKNGSIDAYLYGEPDEAMGGLCLLLGFGEVKEFIVDCCGP